MHRCILIVHFLRHSLYFEAVMVFISEWTNEFSKDLDPIKGFPAIADLFLEKAKNRKVPGQVNTVDASSDGCHSAR